MPHQQGADLVPLMRCSYYKQASCTIALAYLAVSIFFMSLFISDSFRGLDSRTLQLVQREGSQYHSRDSKRHSEFVPDMKRLYIL